MSFNTMLSSYCVLACIINKIPQMLAIIQSKSVKGLSLGGLLLEFWCFCLQISYNVWSEYPLQNYMEYVFLAVQDVILMLLLFYYLDISIPMCIGYFMGFFTVNSFVAGDYLSPVIVSVLYASLIPCTIASRLIQAYKIVSIKDSGSVSRVGYTLSVTTSLIRVYTTATTTGDIKVMMTAAVASLCSATLVSIVTYYRKPVKTD